jgi:GAF domain-containing protein
MQRVLDVLKLRTGFDAVGIRMQDGEDFPYFVQHGFSANFLLTENTLTERTADGATCRDENGTVSIECTCGLVLSGKTDSGNPLFTAGGSCWTNDSFPILAIPADRDPRLHPRNQCIHENYASIALIPIRANHKILGLVQFNDQRKGRFTLEIIELLEGIAKLLGESIMRERMEGEFRESELELQAKNREMKSFTNNLKGQLNIIQSCAGNIVRDLETDRHEQAINDLRRIEDAAVKMNEMLIV